MKRLSETILSEFSNKKKSFNQLLKKRELLIDEFKIIRNEGNILWKYYERKEKHLPKSIYFLYLINHF
jgi:hypothetical protein